MTTPTATRLPLPDAKPSSGRHIRGPRGTRAEGPRTPRIFRPREIVIVTRALSGTSAARSLRIASHSRRCKVRKLRVRYSSNGVQGPRQVDLPDNKNGLFKYIERSYSTWAQRDYMTMPLAGILTISLLMGVAGGVAGYVDLEKIDPGLRERLGVAEPTDTFTVWVVFADRPDLDPDPDDGLPPVKQDYVERVSSVPGVQPRHVDELLNALSVKATAGAIYDITALSFVLQIQPVPVDCVVPEGCEEPQGEARSVAATLLLPVLAGLAVGILAVSIRQLHHRGKEN